MDDVKQPQSNVNSGDKERGVNKQSLTVVKSGSDPVQTALGDFGWWQFWITFALSLLKFPIAWHQLAIIFLAARAPFKCDVGNESTTLFNVTDRCSFLNPVTHEVAPCYQFVYDTSVFQETIITEVQFKIPKILIAEIIEVYI